MRVLTHDAFRAHDDVTSALSSPLIRRARHVRQTDRGRTRWFFVASALVVLKREPQLLNRFVARVERRSAMSTEIVIRAPEIRLGPLERRDRPPNLWMAFEPSTSGLLDRSSGLLRGLGKLIDRDW
jgi:hypothetical protein